MSPSQIKSRPCVQCGYCCTVSPCFVGEWDAEKKQCKFLTANTKCAKYDEIIEREKVLDFLTSPGFDPTKTILFEKEDFKSGVSHPASTNEKSGGLATVISYRPDYILLETQSSGPGLLLLSEIFYPGWKAFVDDKPKRILRGNYLFRVIEVPEGHHKVRFVFDPLSIKIGIGITIFTLFIILNTFQLASTSFLVNLKKSAEKISYTSSECDVLSYTTRSKTAFGGISDTRIISDGSDYVIAPGISTVISSFGRDAELIASSSKIGILVSTEVQKSGYDFSVDKTFHYSSNLNAIHRVAFPRDL